MKPHFVLGMVGTSNIHLKLVVLFGFHEEVWCVLEVSQPTLKNVLNSRWMFVRRKIIGQKLLCWRRNLEFGGGFLRLDLGGFYPGNFQGFFSALGFYFAGFLNVSTAGPIGSSIMICSHFRIKTLLGTNISSLLKGRLSRWFSFGKRC